MLRHEERCWGWHENITWIPERLDHTANAPPPGRSVMPPRGMSNTVQEENTFLQTKQTNYMRKCSGENVKKIRRLCGKHTGLC